MKFRWFFFFIVYCSRLQKTYFKKILPRKNMYWLRQSNKTPCLRYTDAQCYCDDICWHFFSHAERRLEPRVKFSVADPQHISRPAETKTGWTQTTWLHPSNNLHLSNRISVSRRLQLRRRTLRKQCTKAADTTASTKILCFGSSCAVPSENKPWGVRWIRRVGLRYF